MSSFRYFIGVLVIQGLVPRRRTHVQWSEAKKDSTIFLLVCAQEFRRKCRMVTARKFAEPGTLGRCDANHTEREDFYPYSGVFARLEVQSAHGHVFPRSRR